MQELKKILEEIDCRFENLLITDDECRKTALSKHDYEKAKYYRTGIVFTERAMDIVKDIIRNHMNDGWIPVEERLPRKREWHGYDINTNVSYMKRLEIVYMTDTIEYTHGYYDGYKWMDKRHSTIKNVVAWKVHEPYRPERSEG